MPPLRRRFLLFSGLHLLSVALILPALADTPASSPPVRHHATGTGGAIATSHPLATQAGLDVLKNNGNAIDAAVAIALTLGVVDSHNSGIGGGCFMLVRLPSGKVLALDGREMAPAAARRDMYLLPDGSPDTNASKTGPLAPGIPGSLAVYQHVLKHHGTSSLSSHLKTAARLAEDGFRIDGTFASRLKAEYDSLVRFSGKPGPFFRKDGAALQAGDVLAQPDLAKSYRAIAEQGISWFYGGAYARQCAAWMKQHGGLLTREDFSNYKLREREPLRTTYRGHEVIGFPPPSSGGTHVAQILNILEQFQVSKLDHADRLHLLAEAMKLAFADRAHWLGDSDHVDVPVTALISKAYARTLAAKIDLAEATKVPSHGDPKASTGETGKHTTHFTVIDRHGTWVACTATLNTAFGSKVVVPGTGIVLNNQMDDFSIKPGVPNAFGLVGAEANAIAPGKRPLSSMSPTIVLKDGRPILTVGAAGGPTIITQVLLAIVRTLDLNQPLLDAVKSPRFHHQWKPDHITMESDMDPSLLSDLENRGHSVKSRSSLGTSQAIRYHSRTKTFTAVSDPRALGAAATVDPDQ